MFDQVKLIIVAKSNLDLLFFPSILVIQWEKKIGNHVIIHFGACALASRQTQQPFSLQRPFPPRASLS